MKEDPDKPRKMRRKEENDEAPGTPVNDVSKSHWQASAAFPFLQLYSIFDDELSQNTFVHKKPSSLVTHPAHDKV